MDNKIVKVIFKEGWETMYNTDLTQEDYGQILQVEGITLPDGNVEVHFSLTEHNGEAPISIGTVKDNVITVDIPDFILQKKDVYTDSYQAYAWIYVTDGESGRTIRKIVFTIDTRAEPTTNVPEDQKDKFLQEVRQVLAETKEVAQSVRDDADNGKFSGIPGPPGKDGKNGEDGKDGDDGEDGKSAYDYAVEGGFEGTEQEFIDLMAQAGHVDLTGYVSKEQHEAELLKAMVKVTTDKAPFHHITDSANMKVLDFGMEGKIEQRTTSGKNLFDGQMEIGSISIENGQNVTNNAHMRSVNYISVVASKTYIISFEGTATVVAVRFYDSDKIFTKSVTLGSPFVFTVPDGSSYCRFFTIGTDTTNVQFEEGSVATDYEPFTNGPTPNPTHPQEIKLAGVLNEETGRYEHKCCVGNKNLVCEIRNGVMNNNGLYKPDDSYRTIYATLPKGTYILSISCDESIYIVREKKNSVIKNISITSKKRAITVEEYTRYALTVRNTDNTNSFTNFIVQIEYGLTDTDFTPHTSQPFTLTSPVPLTKWDKLVKRDGVYGWSIFGVKYDINKNTINVNGVGYYSVYKGFYLPVFSEVIDMGREAYCTHFKQVKPNGNDIGFNFANNKYMYMVNSPWYDDSLSDRGKSNMWSWLSDNPFEIIVYSSTEQAFIPLPEEEQTLLHNIETYYGVTNVYNEQGCPISLTYCADQELHWNQKLLQIQQAII